MMTDIHNYMSPISSVNITKFFTQDTTLHYHYWCSTVDIDGLINRYIYLSITNSWTQITSVCSFQNARDKISIIGMFVDSAVWYFVEPVQRTTVRRLNTMKITLATLKGCKTNTGSMIEKTIVSRL